MLDPLAQTNWELLAIRYDQTCRRFDSQSPHLNVFESKRPSSDRGLYSQLVRELSQNRRDSHSNPLGLIKAVLYWKYYSQGTANRNIELLGEPGASQHSESVEAARDMLSLLPVAIERNIDHVIDLVRTVSKPALPCFGNTALPTKTTLLHLAYPAVVPIFDKQVLKAVGEPGTGNHSYTALRAYLPHAWKLADLYAPKTSTTEYSSLRAVDMAPWVHRGGCGVAVSDWP